MDFQRYLLIGAIALLSYMLLIEWGQFKTEHSSAAIVAQSQALPVQPTAELPTSSASSEDDIPVATAEMTTAEAANTAATARVRIETDTLVVELDKRGGDVIYAALPKFSADTRTPEIPFVLLEENTARTHYTAQSALIGPNGIDKGNDRALFSSEKDNYRLADDTSTLNVDLLFSNEKVSVTKRFTFTRGDYLVKVSYIVENKSESAWEGQLFTQLKRDNSVDPGADTSAFGMKSFLGVATRSNEEPFIKESFDDLADEPIEASVKNGWVSIVQHYFISAWVPEPEGSYSYTSKKSDQFNFIRIVGEKLALAPGAKGEMSAGLYIGPKDQYRLEKIAPGLDLTVDYGILWWIAQPLFALLNFLHKWLGNWGLAIIAVTVLVKAAFFQLNATAYKSMANMRKVQPKLLEIRERYADDKQKQSQEMMNLYKKEKINPLGGCLPILVQMPVFIALYWVLMESVELRHAPFFGWIKDLSTMDPYFVLPLIMGASMYYQQKLNPPPPDPMQAKVMQWMPVMFTFFFLFFPAGLVLYWVVNNLLSIAQQYIITKRIENA